jgi:hypothetical protein
VPSSETRRGATVQGFLFTTLPTNELGLLARSLPIAHERAQRGHWMLYRSPVPAPGKVIAEAGLETRLFAVWAAW